tara:strand:+ start:1089 stop:1820 length:732 start_codon:yes stop_codon:yes gene_type:complete
LIANNFVVESNFIKKITEIRSHIFLQEKKIKDYLVLKDNNIELLKQNDSLFQKNEFLKKKLEFYKSKFENDSTQNSSIILQAKVVRNSWNKKQNFMTINKGFSDNISPKMGVVNNNGLIGITHTISENFSTIISILNIDLMISAKIKNSGKFGTLSWDGQNPNVMHLTGLPKHVNIKIGDTILTSGYSNILTEEIEIGTISKYTTEKNTNFLNIIVKPFVDFTDIDFVYIVNPNQKNERALIE